MKFSFLFLMSLFATEKFEVPLVQLRNGSEALFYGIAELEAWDWKDESGYKVMCVRCRQNVAPPEFFEPCCPNATSTRP